MAVEDSECEMRQWCWVAQRLGEVVAALAGEMSPKDVFQLGAGEDGREPCHYMDLAWLPSAHTHGARC